jgi:hypothetical protein
MHLFPGDRDQAEGYRIQRKNPNYHHLALCLFQLEDGGRGAFGCSTLCPTEAFFYFFEKVTRSQKASKKSACVLVVSMQLAIIEIKVRWILSYFYRTCACNPKLPLDARPSDSGLPASATRLLQIRRRRRSGYRRAFCRRRYGGLPSHVRGCRCHRRKAGLSS